MNFKGKEETEKIQKNREGAGEKTSERIGRRSVGR